MAKQIPGIRGVAPELVAILEPMKQRIEALSGTPAINDLRPLVLQIVQGSGILDKPRPADPTTPEIDRAIDGLRELVRKAQEQLEGFNTPISVNAAMAFDALGQAQQNLSDIFSLSSDLADQADELADQALGILDLATDVTVLQTTVGDLGDDVIATSTLLDATVTRVDATEDSIDVITAAITSLSAETIGDIDPGIIWQFEGTLDGWTSNFTLATGDFFVSVPDDAGTYLRSPSGIAIDGRLYTRIVARIRRTGGTGWLGRASYATSGGSAHGIDTTNFHATIVTAPIFAGGGWVIVVWDMELLTAGGSDWVDNIIDQIQLELSDDSSTTFDVDWVAIGRVAPSFFAGSLSALTARVTATEDAIDVLTSDVTSLESRATDLEGDVDAVSTAVDTLSTRVTATEDSIDTQSSQITSLTSRVDDAEDDIVSTSTALSALTTRVTSAEGVNTSQSASITTLTSGLASANTAITSNATAISALDTRVTSAEGVNTSQSSAITALQNTVNDGSTGVAATASALAALTTRVTSTEAVNTSQASSITSLNSSVSSLTTSVSANSSAITSLQTSVSSINGQLTTTSQQLSLLSVRESTGESLINPLTTPNNNQDWDNPNFGILPQADIFQVNVGGRNRAAALVRTSGDVERRSKLFEIDSSSIYEVRFSVLKNQAHGYIFFGIGASSDGVNYDNVASTQVVDRAVISGPSTNQYLFATPNGVPLRTNHSVFSANQWYDVVTYIVGADAPINRVPSATINGNTRVQGFPALDDSQVVLYDGIKLGSGARFISLRFLNYYNGVQTDLYCNQITIRRIFGRDAGIDQEIADRTAAVASEQTARISADAAIAQSVTTVSTQVGSNSASISSLQSSVNGISAQWVLQLNVNNRITGIKLAGNATSTSFSVLADQFSIALPGNPGATPVVPFTVGSVNGVPTVGITGNLIVDGSIFTRNLQVGSVTTDRMAPNSVQKRVTSLGGQVFNRIAEAVVANIASITIGDVNSKLVVDWSISIDHQFVSDPAGKITIRFVGSTPGNIFMVKDYTINSRNFLGEVYPGYTRTIVLGPGFSPGTEFTFQIQILSNASTTIDLEFLVTGSTLMLKEEMR